MQLKIYGFLFERLVGKPPLGLEVHAGTGEIVPVKYDGEDDVLEALRKHRRMRAVDPAEYEPVGCRSATAAATRTAAGARRRPRGTSPSCPRSRRSAPASSTPAGSRRIGQISAAVDDPAHHDYFWTGKKRPLHRDFVSALLKSAKSHETNTAIPADDPPPLPVARNYAMFDLEGLPPYADDLDRIYLWGVKVFGEKPSQYLPAQSGFGEDGDREGWFAFLNLAARLFTEYGPDLPFIHWSPYEKTKITEYLNRYGDIPLPALPPLPPGEGRGEGPLPSSPAVGAGLAPARVGVATQILSNLTDLYVPPSPPTVLPLPSYSLKVVDQYVGYRRTLADANGAWSIAKYIKATETNDPAARGAIVSQILAYNEEDLDATWAVMDWLSRKRTWAGSR